MRNAKDTSAGPSVVIQRGLKDLTAHQRLALAFVVAGT